MVKVTDSASCPDPSESQVLAAIISVRNTIALHKVRMGESVGTWQPPAGYSVPRVIILAQANLFTTLSYFTLVQLEGANFITQSKNNANLNKETVSSVKCCWVVRRGREE